MEGGRIAELENLIAVTRDVFGLDRLRLYGHLVRALSAAELPDRALVLWTQLQEEGLAPPEEMLSELAALLRRHGRPVPFADPGAELRAAQAAEVAAGMVQQQETAAAQGRQPGGQGRRQAAQKQVRTGYGRGGSTHIRGKL